MERIHIYGGSTHLNREPRRMALVLRGFMRCSHFFGMAVLRQCDRRTSSCGKKKAILSTKGRVLGFPNTPDFRRDASEHAKGWEGGGGGREEGEEEERVNTCPTTPNTGTNKKKVREETRGPQQHTWVCE
jgi:hypothetical protein